MASDSDQTHAVDDSGRQGSTGPVNSQVSELQIPENPTFEQAIALTQTLLNRVEQGALSPEQTEHTIAQLVATMNGARGFFVAFLTDERSPDQSTSEAVLRALSQAPETVASLLVKNLAMSSAMAIAHRRRDDEANAQGSERVRSRTLDLLRQLASSTVQTEVQNLKTSLESDEGSYHSFLTRWGYDEEQRQAIKTACSQLSIF